MSFPPPLPLQVIPRFVMNDHRGGLAADLIGWKDQTGSILQGAGSSALTTEEYRNTTFQMSFFRHNQNDSLSFVFEAPTEWLPNTIVRPHLHVIPMIDPLVTEYVYLTGYVWPAIDSIVVPDTGGWISLAPVRFPINPGDAFKPTIIDLTNGVGLPPNPAAGHQSFALIYLERTSSNPLDTYKSNKVTGTGAANLALLSLDVSVQVNRNGALSEWD